VVRVTMILLLWVACSVIAGPLIGRALREPPMIYPDRSTRYY
jgi:hypothetical protein